MTVWVGRGQGDPFFFRAEGKFEGERAERRPGDEKGRRCEPRVTETRGGTPRVAIETGALPDRPTRAEVGATRQQT